MAKRIVLVTGSLAEPRVKRIAEELGGDEIEPVVANIGVKVAALMTTEIVERRLKLPEWCGPRHTAGTVPRRPRASF